MYSFFFHRFHIALLTMSFVLLSTSMWSEEMQADSVYVLRTEYQQLQSKANGLEWTNKQLEKQKAETEQLIHYLYIGGVLVVYIGAVCVVISTACIFYFLRKREEKAREQEEQMTRRHAETENRLFAAMNDLSAVQKDKAAFEARKQKEIEELRQALAAYHRNVNFEQWDAEQALQEHPVVVALRKHADRGEKMTDSECSDLEKSIEALLPDFFARLKQTAGLSDKEFIVCLLTRLRIPASGVSVLMGFSAARVSNLRKTANQKLCGDSNAKGFDATIRRL